jgi:hypothetical protein
VYEGHDKHALQQSQHLEIFSNIIIWGKRFAIQKPMIAYKNMLYYRYPLQPLRPILNNSYIPQDLLNFELKRAS